MAAARSTEQATCALDPQWETERFARDRAAVHPEQKGRILLTGGTGYIGGRLIKPLEATGRPLRILARTPERLKPKVPPRGLRPRVADATEVVAGDAFDRDSLLAAMADVDVAYYLIHSLGQGTGSEFYDMEMESARIFAEAARDAGVRRIIYFGGLGSSDDTLSLHLASRQDAGRVLASTGLEVLEFRASVVLGSGSTSFEMIRSLVNRLPVMTTPIWVDTAAQPIAVDDVLCYLVAGLYHELPAGERTEVFEIGGADVSSYAGMMREYGRQVGLNRLMIKVPVLTPRLSSGWLALVTPLYYRVGRHLLEGVKNPTVVTNDKAARAFPDIHPLSLAEAIERARSNEDCSFALTRWSDAMSTSPERGTRANRHYGRRYVDQRRVTVPCTPEQAFSAISCIGGNRGWYSYSWLWSARGLLDQITGGVGSRRGRRDPSCVLPGDTIDFWRVERIDRDHLLRLSAEMQLPGRGWLTLETNQVDAEHTEIVQTAEYDPIGITGQLYWWSLWIPHQFIFSRMLREIAAASGCLRPEITRTAYSADAGERQEAGGAPRPA